MPNQFPPHLSSRWSLAPWLLAALAAGLSACAPMPMPVTETETPAAHVTTHAAMLDTVPPIPPAPVRADGRLQIPQSLVALTQPAGQKRLMGTNDKQSYWPLSAHFETQKNQAYCSVATSVMALNALDIQRPKNTLYPDFPYFTQEDFFRSIDPQLANPEKVAQEGMTLDQLSAVLGHFPITVLKYHASDLTLEQFRELIRTTASHSDRFALLNFKRTLIGEVGGGHWSPLAAFDAATDSALLLDVARYKYPAVWVPVTQLYEAALAVDDDSGLARGLIVIGKP